MKFKCKLCPYVYDETKEGVPFKDLPESWLCPICNAPKSAFEPIEEQASKPAASASEPQKTACDIMAETMSNWGVKWVFGMVGHSNLGMADAVRKRVEAGEMNFITIRHEGAAAFACSAYGKLTGFPAACLSIAGPGATNLLTGLYDAKMDSAPVIALTGQVPSSEAGSYAFQEVDLASVFKDVAVSQHTMLPSANFGDMMSSACRRAYVEGGVSQIIMLDDIQGMKVGSAQKAGEPRGLVFPVTSSPSKLDLEHAANLILKASSPVILAGDGCRYAVDELRTFAEALNCPILFTYKAKGFLPDSHPLSCGVVGRSGTPIAAKFMQECDCIIALGAGFSKHAGILKSKPAILIDRDVRAIGRLRKVDYGLVGDIAETLPALLALVRGRREFPDRRAEIADEWARWRAEKAVRASKGSVGKIAPAAVCAALSKVIPENAIISIDVGNVTYSFGRYFESKNQRMLGSWYLGSIGSGLPGAMGAWCASNDKDGEFEGCPVVAVVGDGGLGQYLAEWTTVAARGMDIKCVVFANGELAKITKEQLAAKFPVWQTKLRNPNFAEYAKSCGTKGVRIEDPAKLEGSLKEAFAEKGPVMIEIAVDPEGM